MESYDFLRFNSSVRVKKEPNDESFIGNDKKMIDKTMDTKNVQFSHIVPEYSKLQECNKTHDSNLNDELEIDFEYVDANRNMNLLAVEKTEVYSVNHWQSHMNIAHPSRIMI
ncbi:hypothetical protein TKK_0012563 [Trichogramma kaykai]